MAASSRLRTWQFIPYLQAEGIEVRNCSFFDESYLKATYKEKPKLQHILRAYVRRFRDLKYLAWANIVIVEKEVFPYLPGWFEKRFVKLNVKYIVDYDDAIFHSYDLNKNLIIRKVFGKKLDSLIRSAACVSVGNTYLQNYCISHGAKKTQYFPTVVDIGRYSCLRASEDGEYRIGWIGSPSTTKYLWLVRDALIELSKKLSVRLVVIGAGRLEGYGIPLEQHEWSEDTEVELLNSIHVGIMPLLDSPWENGKCGYKLIQYMACCKPVVGSPVGINKDIIQPEVGCKASNSSEWYEALESIGENESLRQKMGEAGRKLVEEKYTAQLMANRWKELLLEAVNDEK